MDLVHSLRTDLGRDFSVSLCPQDDLLRAPGIAPVERVKDDFYKDIVVVGASNLNQPAPLREPLCKTSPSGAPS